MLDWLFSLFGWIWWTTGLIIPTFTLLGFVGVVSYLVPIALASFYWKPSNLKERYNAKWAFVSGGSSGIGKSIAVKLAKQGINVVIAALDDALLSTTLEELKSEFPKLEFRAVGVNLAQNQNYMDNIIENTKDIDVQIIVNNAGYLVLKGFVRADLNSQLNNLECNVISHLKVTHHFLKLMVDKNLKGCITFTSSQAAFFVAPSSALYGSGKAFLSSFAASLAIEAQPYGIDVCCIMPGPMDTNFTKGLPKLDALKFFYSISSSPDQVADILLGSIGRIAWRDASLYTLATRLVIKFIDMNVLIHIIAKAQHYTTDFKNHPELR